MLIIQFLLAITTVLFMWSATVKAISILGTKEEQGSLLGFSEGMRGLGALLTAFATLWIFNRFGAEANADSLRAVIITYGIVYILFSILCWIFVPNSEAETMEADGNRVGKEKKPR